MKSKDVQIGHIYAAKVSGKICRVMIMGAAEEVMVGRGGWKAVNMDTRREITIRGSKRLRCEVKPGGEEKSDEKPLDSCDGAGAGARIP